MSFICQTNPVVLANIYSASPQTDYVKLPGTVSWELTADVTEAEEILTADTAGLLVKPCSDTVSFGLDVTSALDDLEWIYNYLLVGTDPGKTNDLDIILAWDPGIQTLPGATITVAALDAITTDYIEVAGSVTPGGFAIDGGNSGAAATTDWSLSIFEPPVFPTHAGGTSLP